MTGPIEILYVEDNPQDVKLLSLAFGMFEFSPKLSIARDGVEAMQFLRDRNLPRPLLVLLDLNLPKKNGLEVLQGIRADPELQDMRVIVMTSSSVAEDLSRCKALRVDDYIQKAQDFDEYKSIVERIRSLCSRREPSV